MSPAVSIPSGPSRQRANVHADVSTPSSPWSRRRRPGSPARGYVVYHRSGVFLAFAKERLFWYVYELIDTSTEQAFYVGKGVGDRVFAHVEQAARADADDASLKLARIRALGTAPGVRIVAHGMNEATALLLEAVLIKKLGLGTLT